MSQEIRITLRQQLAQLRASLQSIVETREAGQPLTSASRQLVRQASPSVSTGEGACTATAFANVIDKLAEQLGIAEQMLEQLR